MADLVKRFRSLILERGMLEAGDRVLAGISGGVDSMVMLHLLHESGFIPEIVHINYMLRGAASDADEDLVRSYAKLHGHSFVSTSANVRQYADESGKSIQEAARDIRYSMFRSIAEERGLGCVAVAHHHDDQVETVLHHLFRGTGIEGLAGMPELRVIAPGSPVRIIRPLLTFGKQEIEDYARRKNIPWRDDASNRSLKYRRSVIRESIIPVIRDAYGAEAVSNIARTSRVIRSFVDEILLPVVERVFAESVQAAETGGIFIDGTYLRAQSRWMQQRLVLEVLRRSGPQSQPSLATVEEILQLLQRQKGARVELKHCTVWREAGGLLLVPRTVDSADRTHAVAVQPGDVVEWGGEEIEIVTVDTVPEFGHCRDRVDMSPNVHVEFVDAESITFPLIIRPWRPGDAFRPLGLSGTMKISDFLTNAKVPAHKRTEIAILESGGEIVCIPGYRISHDFRITGQTRKAVRITHRSKERGHLQS